VSGSQLPTELIDQIRALPLTLSEAVETLDDAQLDTPYDVGKWTVRQVVHHLADAHVNAFVRMKWILTEENPIIKPYDQDLWAKLADVKLPIEISMAILHGVHYRCCFMLESIPEESWQRTAEHPEIGKISLYDLVEIIAVHGRTHVAQITQLRSARGW